MLIQVSVYHGVLQADNVFLLRWRLCFEAPRLRFTEYPAI